MQKLSVIISSNGIWLGLALHAFVAVMYRDWQVNYCRRRYEFGVIFFVSPVLPIVEGHPLSSSILSSFSESTAVPDYLYCSRHVASPNVWYYVPIFPIDAYWLLTLSVLFRAYYHSQMTMHWCAPQFRPHRCCPPARMRIITSGRGKGEGADQIRELGEEATGRSVSHVIMNDMLAKFYLDNQLETKVIFAYGHLLLLCHLRFRAFLRFWKVSSVAVSPDPRSREQPWERIFCIVSRTFDAAPLVTTSAELLYQHVLFRFELFC